MVQKERDTQQQRKRVEAKDSLKNKKERKREKGGGLPSCQQHYYSMVGRECTKVYKTHEK